MEPEPQPQVLPSGAVSVGFEVYALRVGKETLRGGPWAFRDGVYLQCNNNQKDKVPGPDMHDTATSYVLC